MTPNERRVLAALNAHLMTAPRLYSRLADMDKATVDAALVSLQRARLVVLHEHTTPHDPDRSRLIQADGKVFVGACRT